MDPATNLKNLKVRELEWNDFEQMSENYLGQFDELEIDINFGLIMPVERPSKSKLVEWFTSMFSAFVEGRMEVVVAELDGKLVGDCDIRMRRDYDGFSHVGFLDIAVKKGFRGMGVGRAMMETIIEKVTGRLEIVYLDVLSSNAPAKALYRKLGFIQCGSFPGMLKRKGTSIDLERMYLRIEGGRESQE